MMPQINIIDSGLAPVNSVDFDSATKSFSIIAGLGKDYKFSVSYGYQQGESPSSDGQLISLFNPHHSESGVRKVVIPEINKNNTVGWLFTISALTSNQHSHYDDVYFRNAAFVAIDLLLRNFSYHQKNSVANGSTIQISDLFDEEMSILILHRPSVEKLVDLDGRNILPSLHKNGFIPFMAKSSKTWLPGNVVSNQFSNAVGSIRLQVVPACVGFEDFISRVFSELLPQANDYLLKFYYYYQVIEALLQKVFVHKQSESIVKMFNAREDVFLLHDMFEELSSDLKSKKQIKLLFNSYSDAKQFGDMHNACNDFLKRIDLKEKTDPSLALYEVRNVIFHNMRKLNSSSLDDLKKIVEQLEDIVPQLILTFKIPDPMSSLTDS